MNLHAALKAAVALLLYFKAPNKRCRIKNMQDKKAVEKQHKVKKSLYEDKGQKCRKRSTNQIHFY